MTHKAWWRLLAGLGFMALILVILAWTIDLRELVQQVVAFPKQKLLGLLALSLGIMLVRAWRFGLLLRHNGIIVSWGEAAKAFLAGQALAPLPGGEVARGFLVHADTEARFRDTTAPMFAQGFLELLASALLALIGGLFFRQLIIPIGLGFGLLVVLLILVFRFKLRWLPFPKLLRYDWVERFRQSIYTFRRDMYQSVFQPNSHRLSPVFAWGFLNALVSVLLSGLLVYLTVRTYSGSVTYMESVFVFAAGLVVSTLDNFSPSGFGFTEGGMAGLLVWFGLDLTPALAAVAIFRLVTLGFGALVGLAFLLGFYREPFLAWRRTK